MEETRIHLSPPAWLPIIVALLLGGAFVAGKYIESKPPIQSSITVQGEGKVQATPDIAMLSFGVQTGRQKTAQAAMETLAKNMNGIIAAVKAAGVEDKDITTQNLYMSPSYDYNDGRRIDTGFEANQNLIVKVRTLDKISDVLDAAVSKGANQVGGVSFTIDDMTALQAEARKKAIADAQEKAKNLASDLGVILGKFQSYGEGGYYPPSPVMMRMDMGIGGAAMESKAPDVPAGEQEIQVNISLTYEVK